jgi:hypothetical protein
MTNPFQFTRCKARLLSYFPRGTVLEGFISITRTGWQFKKFLASRMAVLTDEDQISVIVYGKENHRATVFNNIEFRLAAVRSGYVVAADAECPTFEEWFGSYQFEWHIKTMKLEKGLKKAQAFGLG